MSPQPRMEYPSVTKSTFWEQFQVLAERHIEEGNMLAGETLWKIERTEQPEEFTIRSTVDPRNCLECSLNPRNGVLTCAPGSLRFQVPLETAGPLQRDGAACSLEEALCLILDELVRDWHQERRSRPRHRKQRLPRQVSGEEE